VTSARAVDRRQRRRLETIEEVLDIAVELMTEQGVAGLSVGEIARRMGIQPPSLYVYFPSKAALYDALFQRGAEAVLAAVGQLQEELAGSGLGLEEQLLSSARSFLGWCLEHPAYAQLLFWRPVPGFTPSATAYAPALALTERGRAWIVGMQHTGLVRADVPADDVLRDWMVLTAGALTQQLANEPDADLETGRYARALPQLVAMFSRHYGTSTPPSRS
jgi:AcrR family transcriptional regulator